MNEPIPEDLTPWMLRAIKAGDHPELRRLVALASTRDRDYFKLNKGGTHVLVG